MLWRVYINVTGCVWTTGYWSETIFIISLTENNIFVKLFETSFGNNIIASFTEFQCQGIWVQTFEIHIQGNFLH